MLILLFIIYYIRQYKIYGKLQMLNKQYKRIKCISFLLP